MFQQTLSCLKLVLWVFINPHLSSTTPPEFMHTLGFMQPQALATKIRHRCGKGRGWAVSVVVLVDGRFLEMLDNATWEEGFGQLGKKHLVCPSVPLNIFQLKARATGRAVACQESVSKPHFGIYIWRVSTILLLFQWAAFAKKNHL